MRVEKKEEQKEKVIVPSFKEAKKLIKEFGFIPIGLTKPFQKQDS